MHGLMSIIFDWGYTEADVVAIFGNLFVPVADMLNSMIPIIDSSTEMHIAPRKSREKTHRNMYV